MRLMTKKEINNFNKICAEFLGVKFEIHSSTWRYKNLIVTELLFHSDWNWIMEVVEKIKYIEDNQEKFFGDEYYLIHFEIDLLNGVDLFIDKKRIFSQSAFGEGQLKEAVVQAINQFLIWYNENK